VWQNPRNVTTFNIVTLWHLEMSPNVALFSNLWYKATFTFYVWIRLGTTLISFLWNMKHTFYYMRVQPQCDSSILGRLITSALCQVIYDQLLCVLIIVTGLISFLWNMKYIFYYTRVRPQCDFSILGRLVRSALCQVIYAQFLLRVPLSGTVWSPCLHNQFCSCLFAQTRVLWLETMQTTGCMPVSEGACLYTCVLVGWHDDDDCFYYYKK